MSFATRLADRVPLPDAVLRRAIAGRVAATQRTLAALDPGAEARFAAAMVGKPIAVFTQAANQQHYELPPEFFALVLGPRRKYSCCLYADGAGTLAEGEERALADTCAHAGLADGQSILELGCGWGSLTLWMAEHYPAASITAVSNSIPQRLTIEAEAARRGLRNVRVITADMNGFVPDALYDRIVSVEMFEHMANWKRLLSRLCAHLRPDGRLFLHVFTHRSVPYAFDHGDPDDWIAQHFFTGGIMPSTGLIRHFPDTVTVEVEWRWNGLHYTRTAMQWLHNFDRNRGEVMAVLRQVYGAEAPQWARRWRLFFLATAGLFAHAEGNEWGVSHYRLRPSVMAGLDPATSLRQHEVAESSPAMTKTER
jgi:cyclopropane-fatty-acyl-phospholipid synthase